MIDKCKFYLNVDGGLFLYGLEYDFLNRVLLDFIGVKGFFVFIGWIEDLVFEMMFVFVGFFVL